MWRTRWDEMSPTSRALVTTVAVVDAGLRAWGRADLQDRPGPHGAAHPPPTRMPTKEAICTGTVAHKPAEPAVTASLSPQVAGSIAAHAPDGFQPRKRSCRKVGSQPLISQNAVPARPM